MAERASNVAEFTVSEISRAVKGTLEDTFGHVRVRGEITGFRGRHGSGHAYFGLKDVDACIDAVVWRSTFDRLRIKPEMGLEVVATGRLTTYPRASKYQLVIDALEPAGAGALLALLEARRKAFAAEGLFDEARKRPLPFLPRVVGVVTSPTGAVIRDILHRLADRFPVHVVVWPVRVQGDTSAAEVAAAIDGFSAAEAHGLPRPDVVVVARGGGSMEDLWGYNEEVVVRAAARSTVPVVSAVGHETDWTLIDHVADRRAPTPTGAAEMVVPVRSDLLAILADRARRLDHGAARGVDLKRDRLAGLSRGLPRPAALLGPHRQRLDLAAMGLSGGIDRSSATARERLGRVAARLSIGALSRQVAHARASLSHALARVDGALRVGLSRRRERLSAAGGRLDPDTAARIARRGRERLVGAADRLDRCGAGLLADRRRRLDHAAKLLSAYSYHAVLERGFVLVRDGENRPVREAAAVAPGASLSLEFRDGRVSAVATGGSGAPEPVEKPAPRRKPRRTAPAADGGQGRLL